MAWEDTFRYRRCGWCGVQDVAMNLSGSFKFGNSSGKLRWWAVLACPRCAGVTVVEHTAENAPNAVIRVFPEPDGVADSQIDHLPNDVEEYYQDAARVMEAGVPDAAAVQLRRTLEAAAAHFEDADGNQIDNGPLVSRIERLIAAGFLTSQFGQALHHVRQVGNVGAHASDERIDSQQALLAYSFTTQTLRNLFEVPGELGAIAGEDEQESSS